MQSTKTKLNALHLLQVADAFHGVRAMRARIEYVRNSTVRPGLKVAHLLVRRALVFLFSSVFHARTFVYSYAAATCCCCKPSCRPWQPSVKRTTLSSCSWLPRTMSALLISLPRLSSSCAPSWKAFTASGAVVLWLFFVVFGSQFTLCVVVAAILRRSSQRWPAWSNSC